MSQANTLTQRIMEHYQELPRSERRLADLVLRRYGNLYSYSATEFAQEASVSKATTARFFKRLGYENFRQARDLSRQDDKNRQSGDMASDPVRQENLESSIVSADISRIGADISLHISSDTQNLRHTLESIRSDDLRAAVNTLAQSDKVWVVGFDDDYALAHFARSMLIRIKPDIRMLPLGGFSVPEEFASITANDAILGFGIKRRDITLMRIVRTGREAGARVILVTDDSAGVTDRNILMLRCRTRGAFLFDSLSAAFSLMTYLCSAVASIIGDPAVERLHNIESLRDYWGSGDT